MKPFSRPIPKSHKNRRAVMYVSEVPDNPDFWKKVKRLFWWLFVVPGLFAMAAITILILMGALKLFGVKEL